MNFDTSDVRVRCVLYRYHNRRHDGEIRLVFSTPNGVMLMELSCMWPDPNKSVLLGEVQTRIVNDGFEDRIVPIVERSETELQYRQEQSEERKAYRAKLYSQYPIAKWLKDLGAL